MKKTGCGVYLGTGREAQGWLQGETAVVLNKIVRKRDVMNVEWRTDRWGRAKNKQTKTEKRGRYCGIVLWKTLQRSITITTTKNGVTEREERGCIGCPSEKSQTVE